MKPRLLKVSYLAWVVVPLGIWFTYQLVGLPHAIWSYSWIDHGQGADPLAERYYTRCRFIGPHGQFDFPAQDGRCGWVQFLKEENL